jgi:hypothetical protein
MFSLFIIQNSSSAEVACSSKFQTINEKQVEVKFASPRLEIVSIFDSF